MKEKTVLVGKNKSTKVRGHGADTEFLESFERGLEDIKAGRVIRVR